jgi:hypothetical protein
MSILHPHMVFEREKWESLTPKKREREIWKWIKDHKRKRQIRQGITQRKRLLRNMR